MTDREKLSELIHNSQYEYDGTKAWYEQCADYLLENGVIVPPCKVGDTVYSVFNGGVRELKVISYSALISTIGNYINIHTVNSRGAVISYELHDFGKTVFLTREEAEKALAEREGAPNAGDS